MKTTSKNVLKSFIVAMSFIAINCYAVEVLKEPDIKGKGYFPKNGFVPDKITAISIAIAVLTPIYGAETIDGEKPFVASLNNGVWTVAGSLSTGHVGGVAEIQISKVTGKILRVTHSK